jgi:NAD(P)-dependent dehydrogenase (short-subunit alcohol dehydrogenase family)
MPNTERKLAIVTGANRGLGLEVCRQLAQQGYRVVLTARDPQQAERAAASLKDAGEVRGAQLDVASQPSIDAFARLAQAELGPIHALVNNAGISIKGFDVNVVRGTLAVNFFGALHVTQALAPLVADGGNVVMVSSGMADLSAYSKEIRARFVDASLETDALTALLGEFERHVEIGDHEAHGWPSSAYRVSKAALNALTRILTRQSARLHINAVCPGWVKTDMGGAGASRTVEQGARGIVWAAMLGADGPHGGFFRDGKSIDW